MLPVQRQSLRTAINAHLTQTMTLMGLTYLEIGQKVLATLASNPALELVEDRLCPSCHRRLPENGFCPVCSLPRSQSPEEPVVFVSSREDIAIPKKSLPEGEMDSDIAPEKETLAAFVLRQIAPDLSLPQRKIAAYILTNLNEDGLLTIPIVEVAIYFHTSLSNVKEVLNLIRRAEPLGVGSPSAQEALLIQLEVLTEQNSGYTSIATLARKAIEHGTHFLSRHNYGELSHLLGISQTEAKAVAGFIADNLNPFPGRSHWGDGKAAPVPGVPVFQKPDVIISLLHDRDDSPLIIEVLLPFAGTLRINPLFKNVLPQADPDRVQQWRSDLEEASLLVKCIQQRNHTMVRMMALVARIQRTFILKGDSYLIPITRASVARKLELHESTISRAVSNKAIQLPNGRIIPLSKFFDRSLAIRTAIKDIIHHEDQTKPLSDAKIATLLKDRGYNIARRTVAKYRSKEGILPAHLRTKLAS